MIIDHAPHDLGKAMHRDRRERRLLRAERKRAISYADLKSSVRRVGRGDRRGELGVVNEKRAETRDGTRNAVFYPAEVTAIGQPWQSAQLFEHLPGSDRGVPPMQPAFIPGQRSFFQEQEQINISEGKAERIDLTEENPNAEKGNRGEARENPRGFAVDRRHRSLASGSHSRKETK